MSQMLSSTGSESGDNLDSASLRVAADAIHAQVERIIAKPPFSRSERLSRFLRFTVEQALLGQGHKLKEYVVGIEVFDRDASFDPRAENIVRVEARRLRTSLIEYYATAGRDDPVAIEFPKGTYAPVFTERLVAEPVEIPAAPSKRLALNKNLLAVLFLAAIALAALIYWAWTKAQTGAGLSSIAVIPFVNLTGDPEQEYFTDGLTDEIIDALTKVDGLHVVARTSSFQFKGKSQDVRRIGEQLKVSTVLEGSVRKTGNRLRITAQLIKTADGYHLWSRTDERELKDIFVVQEETARAIVQTLSGKPAGDLRRKLVSQPTNSLEAYNLYLKGRFFWYKWTPEGIQKSIPYFDQAIAKDPNYALAYAGLADAWGVLAHIGFLPVKEAYPKRDAALSRALELDPNLAEARLPLAMKKAFVEWDWTGAEQEFRRIFELNPRFAEAHRSFGAVLNAQGRFEESFRELQQAVALDPLSPFINSSICASYSFQRRYDEAIECCRKIIEMDNGFFRSYLLLGLAYAQKKMYPEAIEALEKATSVAGGGTESFAALGYVYGVSGRKKEAERLLRELQELSKRRRVSHAVVAWVYLGLGDQDRALDWLEKAYKDQDGLMVGLKVHPIYDSLRSEPRYQALLKRMNLSP